MSEKGVTSALLLKLLWVFSIKTMYPAQTSLIPAQIALAKFLENQGWQAFFSPYPYWYLGTTPFRYLTGPILPLLFVGIHKALPQLSLFTIHYSLITIAWLLGAGGFYCLVRELKGTKITATLSAFFYLFGPFLPFLFRFSGGIHLISFSILPYGLVLYLRLLKKWDGKLAILLCLLISFILLLDVLIIPTLLVGMVAIFLAQVGWKKAEKKLKGSIVLLFFSFLVVTLWYTFGYWLVSLTGPSLAGKGRVGVIFQLSKLLPTALAFTLAVFSVRFFKKRHLFRDFCFFWLFIFGFLTLIRFISDPDFWLDWLSYNLELQFGLAILGGLVLERWGRVFVSIVVGFLLLAFWLFLSHQYVIGTLQPDISQTIEYQIGKQLSQIANPGERVFLSGTTAFWLNAFFDIPQIRGGVDQGSVDPHWRRAVWEIREGREVEKSLEWLKELGVSYLVVHTQDSAEFYHDFSYPEKFEQVPGLKKIYDQRGDRIYEVLDFF